MNRLTLLIFSLLLCWPGLAFGAPRVVVPNRDIARGEVLSQNDLMLQPAPGAVQPGTATQIADLAGMETRRLLHAGETIRFSDVRRPILVNKGTIVTMIFEEPGIMLSASMRAISSGGMGEIITVQNPVSFRQVGAVVIGPGKVKALDSGITITPTTTSYR